MVGFGGRGFGGGGRSYSTTRRLTSLDEPKRREHPNYVKVATARGDMELGYSNAEDLHRPDYCRVVIQMFIESEERCKGMYDTDSLCNFRMRRALVCQTLREEACARHLALWKPRKEAWKKFLEEFL